MSPAIAGSTHTLVDEVYASLKEDILALNLAPGTNLLEVQMAERYGVSRTPVREALRQLAAEGLVTIIPQRGAVVSELSMQDVIEAYQVRELLEPAACRMAVERMSDEEIAALEALLDYQPVQRPTHQETVQQLAIDDELHSRILAASGSELLRQIAQDVRARTARARFIAPYGRDKYTVQEHKRVVEALRQRDPAAAEAAMREHIANAKVRLTR